MSLKGHEACSPLPERDLAETDRGDRVVAGLRSSVRKSAAFISEETGNHGGGEVAVRPVLGTGAPVRQGEGPAGEGDAWVLA